MISQKSQKLSFFFLTNLRFGGILVRTWSESVSWRHTSDQMPSELTKYPQNRFWGHLVCDLTSYSWPNALSTDQMPSEPVLRAFGQCWGHLVRSMTSDRRPNALRTGSEGIWSVLRAFGQKYDVSSLILTMSLPKSHQISDLLKRKKKVFGIFGKSPEIYSNFFVFQ